MPYVWARTVSQRVAAEKKGGNDSIVSIASIVADTGIDAGVLPGLAPVTTFP